LGSFLVVRLPDLAWTYRTVFFRQTFDFGITIAPEQADHGAVDWYQIFGSPLVPQKRRETKMKTQKNTNGLVPMVLV